jgi:hypothetical protein
MRYHKWLLGIYGLLFAVLPLLSAQMNCGTTGTLVVPPLEMGSTWPKSVITIPVVFHVLYSEPSDSLSLGQLQSQLAVLNADFRARNSDLVAVIPPHRGLIADMEINFVLASEHPDGQAASGVVYRDVSDRPQPFGAYFAGNRRAICYDELGGSDAWCTDCYLNVWVVRNDLFAGKAVFPTEVGTTVPRAEDGIYINPDRVGTVGTVTAPYDLGRTLTHEVGHYLNLYHPWGPTAPDPDCDFSCCDGRYDDLVDDTPEQWRTYLGECPNGAPSSCGPPDNYQNFMTFANDACLLMFTQGQRQRVRQSLLQYRPGLLEANCADRCVTSASEVAELPGKVWIRQSTLYLEGVPAGVVLHWRTRTGQLCATWINESPYGQQWTLPVGPAGIYVLTWHWEGHSGSTLLYRE